YWWAPELGYTVKRSFETRAGIGTNETFELTSIQTPAPASPPATSSVAPPAQAPTTVPTAPAASLPTPPAKAATTKTTATPSTAPKNAPAASGSVADRLQALKDLLDRKLITPAEYEAKRKAILDAL